MAAKKDVSRLEAILASAGVATWVLDVKSNKVQADATLLRLFGLESMPEREMELDVYLKTIHPNDLPSVQHLIQRCLEEKQDYEARYRVLRGEDTRTVLARGFPELDSCGKVRYLSGAVIDISEWRRADEQRQQFGALVEHSLDAIAIHDRQGRAIYTNAAAAAVGDGTHLRDWFVPQDQGVLDEAFAEARSGRHVERQLRSSRRGWVALSLFPQRDLDGNISGVASVAREINAQKRAEQTAALERSVLELIAQRASFAQVLEFIVRQLESASLDGMLCSILLLDQSGKRLLHGAAPSLPAYYNRAINGLEIGPAVGSCGTAAFTGEPVTVTEIETDPLWAEFKQLARKAGLAACTSLPILSLQKEVLGTVAMYYRQPHRPGDHDRGLMESARYLAGVVIERERAQRAAERSEAEFQTLANTIPQLAWMAGPDGRIFWFNDRWFQYTGTTLAQMEGWGWHTVVEPNSLEAVNQHWQTSLEQGTSFELDIPVRATDGSYRVFLTRVEPIHDAEGKVERWFGTATDIDEQRRNVDRTKCLVEATSQAIWIADRQGRLSSYSASWSRLTGQGEQEMLGQGWLQAVYLHDRERVLHSWERSVGSGQIFEEHFRVWSSENRFVHVRARGVPLRGHDGNVLEWFVANTDVTEQMEAEQQLRERASYAAFRTSIKEVLSSDSAEKETLQKCCEAVTGHLGLDAALLWKVGEEGFELQGWHGQEPPAQYTLLPRHGHDFAHVADSPRGQLNNALSRSSELPGEDWILVHDFQSLVGHPITAHGEVIGLVLGFSRSILPVNITDEIRDATESLSEWFKRKRIEAEQQQLFQVEQALRAEAETMLSLSERLAQETSLKGFVQTVTDVGTVLSGAAFGAFFYNLVDARGESYTLYTLSGVPAENFSKFPMPRNTGVFAPTFRGEGTVRSDDITEDERYGRNKPNKGIPEGHLPVRSYLAVPVKRRNGEVVGGLFFGHPEVGQFTEHHARLMESIAAHAALGFDRTPLS